MNYEDLLKRTILPDLDAGRINWDRPHTEAVVEYMKRLIAHNPDLNLDRDVLVTAAYAHDWGYGESDVQVKEAHMKIGAAKLAQLLKNKVFDFMTPNQKQRAVHLVRVHDTLATINDFDEHILVEADTLGALDVSMVKPNFDRATNDRYMQSTRERRFPLFVTDYGKQQFEKLCQTREVYYQRLTHGR